jgi:hypothetical protein
VTEAVPQFQGALLQLASRAGGAVDRVVSRIGNLSKTEGLQFITDAYPAMVDPLLSASALLTSQWYAELAPTKVFVPEPADLPAAEKLAASGRWALLQDDPVTALKGSATRSVFDSSRRTVRDNAERENVRWTRYASGNACGFCRMLATRALTIGQPTAPGLYRTKSSAENNAHTADIRGHDHCKCIAVPVRNGNYQPPAYVHDWLADYDAVSRDADGHLLPEWQIADLMEKKGAERLGETTRPVGRPRKAAEVARGKADTAKVLVDQNHEQAAAIGKTVNDRVQIVKQYIDRADDVAATAVKITGRAKQVTDLADKLIGDAVPILHDVKVVVDATHKATSSAKQATGGAKKAANLVNKTVDDTVAIAHGAKQITDDVTSVLDDVTFAAAGIRQFLSNTSNAVRDTATDARTVSGVADLVAKVKTAVDTATRVHADGAALVDQAKGTVEALQRIVQGVAEIPDVLRAPLADAQKFAQSIKDMAAHAGLTADDAASVARSVQALVDAVAEYRRGPAFDDTRNTVRVQSERADVTPQKALTADEQQQRAILPGTEPLALPAAPQRALERGTGGHEPVAAESVMKAIEAAPTVEQLDNLDDELAKPFGGEPEPTPKRTRKPKRTLDDVEADMNAALEVGDDALVDKLADEMDRIELREKAAAERAAAKAAEKAAARDATAAAKTAELDAKYERMSALIEDGYDEAEAEAEVFGTSVDSIRRRNFMQEMAREGNGASTFTKAVKQKYYELANEAYQSAEEATNGFMVKAKYQGLIDPASLWGMSERDVRKYMSDEMAAWFDQHGRITFMKFKNAVLSGRGNWRDAMTEDYLQ